MRKFSFSSRTRLRSFWLRSRAPTRGCCPSLRSRRNGSLIEVRPKRAMGSPWSALGSTDTRAMSYAPVVSGMREVVAAMRTVFHTDLSAQGADARLGVRRSLVCAAEAAGDGPLDLRRSRRRDVVRGAPSERLVAGRNRVARRRGCARARRRTCGSIGHPRFRGRVRVGARRPSVLRRADGAAARRQRDVLCARRRSPRAAVDARRAAPTARRR
jgi:hypothetical protein